MIVTMKFAVMIIGVIIACITSLTQCDVRVALA